MIFQISSSGTVTPHAIAPGGDAITNVELDEALAGDQDEDGLDADVAGDGQTTVNRTIAKGPGAGSPARDAARAKSNPELKLSFDGPNLNQQRFANGGNQFTVEPPDQALCVGNGFVLSSVNDVLRIFDTSGNALTGAVDLNTFYGYAPAIDRTKNPLQFGPSITDPVCYFDADTQRFFHVVLTLDRAAPTTQGLSGKNHLDIAVSNGPDPLGFWTVFKLPVQNDGTQGTPDHKCIARVGGQNVHGPCLGDYPHIGADRNAIFLTTNEFNLAAPGFRGAQIYAVSKRALAAGSRTVNVALFDTNPLLPVPGFTVWPATSPGGIYANDNGGTEFLLSSDAVFNDDDASTQLLVWSVTNTASMDGAAPAPALSRKAVGVTQYAVPPPSVQKPGSTPLRDCVALADCSPSVGVAAAASRTNPIAALASNDSRMQQVTYANGKLWGALDTAVSIGGATKAGIAYFVLNPNSGVIFAQGVLGVANNNLTYPALAVTPSGRGVLAFTLVGDDNFPSAGYVGIDAKIGAGELHVAAAGAGPQDGFTGYLPLVAARRPRWGDYGAAAVDGNSIWISSEYIAQTCTLAEYRTAGASFGTCGGTRAPLGNWATRISKVTP
ncbi:MAG: hypothetical protein ACJ79H_08870 [Myxococcales bacterium]